MKTRVLIVDDSVFTRQSLARALDREGDLCSLPPVGDGMAGLAAIAAERPDVVILDIDMPVMDGITTLREVRKRYPGLPVIMFSAQSERGAAITIRALANGASDYLTKPCRGDDEAVTFEATTREMVDKIRALRPRPKPPAPGDDRLRPPTRAAGRATPEILLIGVSTGGPNALAELLPRLPADFPVPIMIVQHMPPIFSLKMAEHLDDTCKLEVREAVDGAELVPGNVWIAPGGRHMAVDKRLSSRIVTVDDGAKINNYKPSVDVLFTSAAKVYRQRTLAVVMTGMGQDGTRGARAIVDQGGRVFAQDRSSCIVWGMPRSVVEAGLAEREVALDEMAALLVRTCSSGHAAGERRP